MRFGLDAVQQPGKELCFEDQSFSQRWVGTNKVLEDPQNVINPLAVRLFSFVKTRYVINKQLQNREVQL
jgi:hypothetical protein